MDKTCIYLRKSRADEELEKSLGQGETLSKHRKALLKFAKERNLNIVEIKEEIVSGDSLFFRPKMLELLKELEDNKYTGVLVMDIDRLGRGGMKDQGIILDAFKESKTKIITPGKTYDLEDEMDEEMTEFKTFFSRRELKTINRRMQGGRVRSVEDGNYIATNPPIGYDIDHIGKCRTLKINEHEEDIIKIIFNMYIEGNGAKVITNHLNTLGYKTKLNNDFSQSSVLTIIKNPIYIGKVTWRKKDIKKSKDPNKVKDTRTRDKSEWIVSEGKHQAIIDMKTWDKAQEILNNRYHIPYQLINAPVNPFAGVIICGICGKKMIMRNHNGIDRLMCTNKCGNKSNRFDYVEKEVIKALREYLKQYKIQVETKAQTNNVDLHKKQLNALTKELNTLGSQKMKLFDFLERGIYDESTFIERSNNIDNRIAALKGETDKLNILIESENAIISQDTITNFENIVSAYESISDVEKKNRLIKTILYKIEYTREQDKKPLEFSIKIYPKLLK